MTWQAAILMGLALVLVLGFAWFERSRPSSRVIALVAALAALAVAGRLVLTPLPNVVATTDIAFITGLALGAAPGFAVGALAAPISNIWLGQGPWTVWEMAGWGMAGLAGAAFASLPLLRGRRPSRLVLASACAAVGLLYGALLDLSVMVTYGGEQSLDRYLALSARGIPFNVAHAVGNFAIALAAGPALVRMIARYRERLEFTWHPAGALGVAVVVLSLALPLAGPEPEPAQAAGGKALSYLTRQQNSDGGFSASPGQPSSAAMTGWAMLGLEAAGRNPLDVRKGSRSPVSFLRANIDRISSTGDLERTILALEGAGVSPREFAGRNLIYELRQRRDGDGSFDGQVNLTAFGILALRAAGEDDVGRSRDWLKAAQNEHGGWGFRPGAASDADSTGAAMQALAAARSDGPLAAGASFLRATQRDDGGWSLAGGITNSQSTAWAIQGLVAASSSRGAVRDGIGHLHLRRQTDGHYRYSEGSDQTPIWVTGQALMAVNRSPLPIAAVERAPKPEPDPDPTPSSGSGTGGGGDGLPDAVPDFGTDDAGSTRGGGGLPPGFDDSLTGPGAASRGVPDAVPGEGPPVPGGADTPVGPGEALPLAGGSIPASATGAAEADAEAPDDGLSTPVLVAGGLGGLALALVAGFFWYRRTLP